MLRFLAIILLAAPAQVAVARDVNFLGLDTQRPVSEALDQLNQVKQASSPHYDELWFGVLPDEGAEVMIGARGGAIKMLSVTEKFSFSDADRKSIAGLEDKYGLLHNERVVAQCENVPSDIACITLRYDCADLDPVCRVEVQSFSGANPGRTRVIWQDTPLTIGNSTP